MLFEFIGKDSKVKWETFKTLKLRGPSKHAMEPKGSNQNSKKKEKDEDVHSMEFHLKLCRHALL